MQENGSVWFWWTFAIVFWVFPWLDNSVWHGKPRYSIQYSVPYASVTKEPKPHTCDFMAAPIGNKNCSYEPEVASVRTGTGTGGKQIFSLDNGEHWYQNNSSDPVKPSVVISWKRVEDE